MAMYEKKINVIVLKNTSGIIFCSHALCMVFSLDSLMNFFFFDEFHYSIFADTPNEKNTTWRILDAIVYVEMESDGDVLIYRVYFGSK